MEILFTASFLHCSVDRMVYIPGSQWCRCRIFMPRISFTPNLGRHLDAPSMQTAGDSIATVFEEVFRRQPELRGYLLDDQGCLRRHVAVFVDGRRIRDPAGLSDAVTESSDICVVQALSGG
jgi:hypothetical protein